jgi:membrane protease YdiL (CAAX protease family)
MEKSMKRKVKPKITGFAQKHIFIFSVIVIVTALTIQICTGKIVQGIDWSGYEGNLMMQVVPTLFLCLILKKLVPFITLGFTRKGLIKGLLLGWLMIVMSFLNVNYFILKEYGITMPPVTKMITFTLWMLMIGVFEEVLIRGIILNNMIKKWGGTKKGIYLAVFMSSLLFGIAHLVNLIESPGLVIVTLAQVVYAFFIGVFFASVYLRSKNIWVVIIYHALMDFASYYTDVFSKAVEMTDISLQAACVNIVLTSVFLMMGLWLLRKVEVKDEKVGIRIDSHIV